MEKVRKTAQRIRRDQRGFTLVELMLTIAILAIVTMPILNYFTDSAKKNADSRMRQNATVEAQNILEKFKKADYSLSDQNVVVSAAPDWSVKTGQVAAGQEYTLKKTETIDKSTFDVETKITPVSSVDNGTNIVDYKRSVIGSMDTAKDVLSADDGLPLLDAKLYFLTKHEDGCNSANVATSLTSNSIGDYLERTIKVTGKQDPDASGNVIIKVDYEYVFSATAYGSYPTGISSTDKYEENIEAVSLPADQINNFYIFYQPMNKDDRIIMDTDSTFAPAGVANDQIKLYIIAQKSVNFNAATTPTGYTKRPSGYTLSITDNGIDFKNKIGKIYTNLSGSDSELNATAFTSNVSYSLVEDEAVDRVADIEVTILRNGKEITKVNGSKVQN